MLLPTLAKAQYDDTNNTKEKNEAVTWEKEITWLQIKKKAKAENKYIFIDCYATWCAPCKMMDKLVFTNDTVSNFLNENFVSVKVQMDTSKHDDESTKVWYTDAHKINKEFKVNAYPTFLFLSPTGELVHQAVGYYGVQQFIGLMAEALNPEKQYFIQMAKYKQGFKDYSKMRDLANKTYRMGNKDTAMLIAQDYINNYLINLKKSDLFTKENMEFIRSYIGNSKEKGFQLLYKNEKRVDRLMKDSNFVESMAHYIISMEEVQPYFKSALKSGTTPDWEKLGNAIKEKYNSYYSDRVITEAKIRWYGLKQVWPEFSTCTVKFVQNYVLYSDDDELADRSWQIFLHSTDKSQLEAALEWTKRVITRSTDSTNILPNIMDTYANLVYKISYLFNDKQGIQSALAEEEKALHIAIQFDNKMQIENFQSTLEKMKAGIQTWSQK
jgi:thioredoxin-related protein